MKYFSFNVTCLVGDTPQEINNPYWTTEASDAIAALEKQLPLIKAKIPEGCDSLLIAIEPDKP